MKRAALVLIGSMCVLGCGGGEVSTSQDVIDEFSEKTGELLIIEDPVASLPYETLGFGVDPEDPEFHPLAGEFGSFTIFVLKDGEDYDAGYESLIEPSKDEEVEPIDDNGIVWTRTSYLGGKSIGYSATKRYGENVILRWQAGSPSETDERFDRLNTILSGLTEGD